MNSHYLSFAMAIGDIVLKSTLLLALAWGATQLARNSSAAFRHTIWLLALGAILCIPALETISPRKTIVSFATPQAAPKPIEEPISTFPINVSAIPDDLPIHAASAPPVDIGGSASPIPPASR